jgi:hypothetical protein
MSTLAVVQRFDIGVDVEVLVRTLATSNAGFCANTTAVALAQRMMNRVIADRLRAIAAFPRPL